MVKHHSDSERVNLLPPHGLFFQLATRVLLYAPSHREAYTTVFDTPAMVHWLEREIAQWVDHEGSIR